MDLVFIFFNKKYFNGSFFLCNFGQVLYYSQIKLHNMKIKNYLKRLGALSFTMLLFGVAQVNAQEELTVVVDIITDNDAIISWNAIGVTTYNVQLCVGGIPVCKDENLDLEQLNKNGMTGELFVCAQAIWGNSLDPETEYTCTVTPVGSSVLPATGVFTTAKKTPVISYSDAFISWDESIDATSYTVEICEDSYCKDASIPTGQFSVCARSVWGGALNPGTDYTYTVTPVGSIDSPISGNFQTEMHPAMVSHSDAIISWSKIGDATRYNVEICTADVLVCKSLNTNINERFVSAQTVWGGALDPETDYIYTVTPLDDSTGSSVVAGNFTTGATPPPITRPGDPGTPEIICPVLTDLWIKKDKAKINGDNIIIYINPKDPEFGSLTAVEVYANTSNNAAPNTKVIFNGVDIDLTKTCPNPTSSVVDFSSIYPGGGKITIKVTADKCGPGRPATPPIPYVPSGILSIDVSLCVGSLCGGGGGGDGDDSGCAWEGYTCPYEVESSFDVAFEVAPTHLANPNAENKQLQDCFNVIGVRVDCNQVKGVVIKRYTDGSVKKELK